MGNPFAKRDAMQEAINKAMAGADFLGPVAVQMVMMQLAASLGQYRSRGKGRGTPARVYGNPPSKYMPHQGKRECERRRRRIAT